jgi:hypothetical protein
MTREFTPRAYLEVVMSYASPAYDLGNEIGTESTLKSSSVYRDIFSLLMTFNGVDHLMYTVSGAKSRAHGFIMRAVAMRTLDRKKPFECIRVRQLLDGMPINKQSQADCSERTLRRGLHNLCKEGLLVRFTSEDGCDCFYALNVEEIMKRLKSYIDKLSATSSAKAAGALYKSVIESDDFRKLTKIIKYFAGRVIDDIVKFKCKIAKLMRAVLQDVVEIPVRAADAVQTATTVTCHAVQNIGRTVVANLAQNVANAKNTACEAANKRQSSIAGRTILNEQTGFIDAAAGMALWHKEVRDADSYRGYVEKTTSKVNGMMKNWLKELKAQGYDEPGIRDLIKSCVQGWEGTVQSQKKIPGVSKTGKPYQTEMMRTPDFEFYYAHRTALTPMLISWSTQGFLDRRPQGASAGGRGNGGNGVYGYGFF